jgi:hypothetical protein
MTSCFSVILALPEYKRSDVRGRPGITAHTLMEIYVLLQSLPILHTQLTLPRERTASRKACTRVPVSREIVRRSGCSLLT